ncbi:Protein GVQW1 [Plecturocebus cupreus]
MRFGVITSQLTTASASLQWCDHSSLQPRPPCSGVITAHYSLGLPAVLTTASASLQWCDHTSLQPRPPWLKPSSCLSLLSSWDYGDGGGSHYVAQAGLELLDSSNLPTSASQSVEITGMSLHSLIFFFNSKALNPSNDRGGFYYPIITEEETEALRRAIAWPGATQLTVEENSKPNLPDCKPRPLPLHLGVTLTRHWVLRAQSTLAIWFHQCKPGWDAGDEAHVMDKHSKALGRGFLAQSSREFTQGHMAEPVRCKLRSVLTPKPASPALHRQLFPVPGDARGGEGTGGHDLEHHLDLLSKRKFLSTL